MPPLDPHDVSSQFAATPPGHVPDATPGPVQQPDSPSLSIDTIDEESNAGEHHVPVNYAPRTGLRLGIIVCIIALSLGVGFYLVQHHRAQVDQAQEKAKQIELDTPPTVDVVAVHYAPSAVPLTLPGETEGWDYATLNARVNGYVEKWFVDIGDKVTENQTLAVLATPDLDAQLEAAKAKLNASKAQVGVEQANAAFAKSSYERWQGSGPGIVSEQEREEKKAAYDSSLAKVEAAKAQVVLSQADVTSLTTMTSYKNVKAPFGGVITSRRIDTGDLVTAGSTTSNTPLYSVANLDRIRVFVQAPQNVESEIVDGMPATVLAPDGTPHAGSVARNARSIDPASRTLRVEVDVPNADGKLVPGMYLQVRFDLLRKSLLQVPAAALLNRDRGMQVAVVNTDRIMLHPVQIAEDQGAYVEVSSGVSDGDKVALNLSSTLGDGDTVVAQEITDTAAPPAPTPASATTKPAVAARE